MLIVCCLQHWALLLQLGTFLSQAGQNLHRLRIATAGLFTVTLKALGPTLYLFFLVDHSLHFLQLDLKLQLMGGHVEFDRSSADARQEVIAGGKDCGACFVKRCECIIMDQNCLPVQNP